MTSLGNSTDEKTTSVSLTITNLDLLDADEQREDLFEDLTETLTTLLITDFDHPKADVEAQLGHWYATVSPTYPDCDEPLDIQGAHLRDDGDAFAVARCTDECGWTGNAMFKLIDLDESVQADYESSVLGGTKTPTYHHYRDRDA